MKLTKLLSVSALLFSALLVCAQPPAPPDPLLRPTVESTTLSTNVPPSFGGALDTALKAIQLNSTNVWYAVYAMKAPALEKKWGGGIGAFWNVADSKYLLAGARLDYVNGGFWMPSGNMTLQMPINLSKWVTITPLAYAGMGIPVSGATIGTIRVPGSVHNNNGEPTAITGIGAALRLFSYKNATFDAVYDREQWSGFPGWQERFGLAFKGAF